MSEPIYAQLTRERYHDRSTTTTGDHMNVIEDIKGKLDEGVAGIEGWIGEFKTHLPALGAEAERITTSPVFRALEGLVLSPVEEAFVARVIGDLVNLRPAAQAAVVDDQGPAEVPAA